MTDTVASGPAAEPSAPLDVVVLGGAGHVGLPLSLSLVDSGLRVGIFDIDGTALERIAGGQMPFMENGADELLPRVLATGRLEMSTSAAMIARADTVILVIGTPVDEFLGPSMRVFERAVDQIAPHVADGALVVLRSTVYPGTTEYVTAAFEDRGLRVDVAFCPERIAEGHALEELRSLPQIIGADDPVAGDRAEALFRHLTSNTIRTSTEGGGAHQAVHQHLAVHEVRHREPVLRHRGPGGRGLHEHPARDPRGLPACRGPARPGLRGRPVPVQGHDAAGGLHVGPLPAGPGGHADQRGHAGLHRLGAGASPRQPAREDGGHPGHGVQGGVGRHPRLALLQAPQAPRVGGCEGAVHRPLRGRCAPGAAGRGPGVQRDPGHRRAAPRLPVTRPRRREVVDIWNATGGGIRLGS